MQQLYDQVQLTAGCSMGETAQKSFTLKGLRHGAYHEVLGPWVKKTLIGQGHLKLATASLSSLQHGATDLLATSNYFKGNILMPGKLPVTPAARKAGTNSEAASSPNDTPSADPLIEGIVWQLRSGFPLSLSQTTWMRTKYRCFHCLSNSHTLAGCRSLSTHWKVSAVTPGDAPAPRGRMQNGRIAGSRRDQRDRHNASTEQATPPVPAVAPITPVPTVAPKAQVATHTVTTQGENPDSEPDESDDTFTHLG
jgi:hypothetical protein